MNQGNKRMKKVIIGVAGEIASGKDTAGKYIAEKYNALSLRFSQPLRDILDRMSLPQNRENMAKLSLYLRKAFGEDVFSKVLLAESEASQNAMIVIDGVRRLPDIIHMETNTHFYFIYIDASADIRYERLIQRRQNTDDATKTPAQFTKDALLETESQILELKERADFVINNDGTLEELERQIDDIIAAIRAKDAN